MVLLELIGDVIDQHLVEVIAAQVRVAVDPLDLENAVADVENGDIERTAAQVEDCYFFVLLLVQAVGQRRRRRLIDDSHALARLLAGFGIFDFPLGIEAGNLGGVDRRLALGVVEVGGHGNDRLAHRMAEVSFRGLLQLTKHHGRDLRRRVLLAVDVDFDQFRGAADDLVRN